MPVSTEKALSILGGIVLMVLGSLVGYIFYGHIMLASKVETVITKQEQGDSERRDLWGKYNKEQDDKFEFVKNYYEFKLEEEKRWTDFYREK